MLNLKFVAGQQQQLLLDWPSTSCLASRGPRTNMDQQRTDQAIFIFGGQGFQWFALTLKRVNQAISWSKLVPKTRCNLIKPQIFEQAGTVYFDMTFFRKEHAWNKASEEKWEHSGQNGNMAREPTQFQTTPKLVRRLLAGDYGVWTARYLHETDSFGLWAAVSCAVESGSSIEMVSIRNNEPFSN